MPKCGDPNRPFYRPAPDCDGEGSYPFNYYFHLTKAERNWLTFHPEIAQNFEDYLNSNTYYFQNGIQITTKILIIEG